MDDPLVALDMVKDGAEDSDAMLLRFVPLC